MITHENNGKTYLLALIPEHVADIHLDEVSIIFYNAMTVKYESIEGLTPYMQYEVIGKASELTEEQISLIVAPHNKYSGFNNMDSTPLPLMGKFKTLLSTHSLQPETTLVLEVKK